jgi:regulator of nucleoside diphosphate kinase
MKKAASVFLRAEIKECDAEYLLDWLGDSVVTQFLADDSRSKREVKRLITSVPSFLWQMNLNRDGHFYMIDCGRIPVGFIRLSEINDAVYEIVIVLGNKSIWRKGYGTQALKEGLNIAFFEHRAKKIIANIFLENSCSLHLFEKANFQICGKSANTIRYSISYDQFRFKDLSAYGAVKLLYLG